MFSLIKLQRVFTVHQVPKAFHEDSIISGYRHPRSSATDCVLSLFQLTNETLNVWTHFLPTWYIETVVLLRNLSHCLSLMLALYMHISMLLPLSQYGFYNKCCYLITHRR
uniref:Uncharacterized protein n=1 Tax=Sinocyclocheilus rhinocerous TaxID=307959 RepID=A0A673M2J4_9TELE